MIRIDKYSVMLFTNEWQTVFLWIMIALYILFLIIVFSKKKKIWFWKHIIFFGIFAYAFLLINLSFLPIIDLPFDMPISEKINFIPFNWYETEIYGFRLLYLFVLIPAWFFAAMFSKNFKKILLFWIALSIFIEASQLLLIYLWDIYWFRTTKVFNINDIFTNFVWFTIWIPLFIILHKIYRYFTDNYIIMNKKEII